MSQQRSVPQSMALYALSENVSIWEGSHEPIGKTVEPAVEYLCSRSMLGNRILLLQKRDVGSHILKCS
ncbi:hypothetical protein WG66_013504 [Moniliophthora roreri]|nr:hypothetical protein WG66_013504 [Moniliophthora roreri]